MQRDYILQLVTTAICESKEDVQSITIHTSSGVIVFEFHDADAQQPRTTSDTEARILDFLQGGQWHTAAAIAAAVCLPCSGSFRAVLANMAERGTIESSTRSGYRKAA